MRTRTTTAVSGRDRRAREASTIAAMRPLSCDERAIAMPANCGMRRKVRAISTR